ncbi:MAG: hypothetical protein D6685_19315 [Bacteroidetes bacterium]|nr:hypothetical protein AWN76_003145 [Rhodothermaceae bacterium RA]RMH49338.1 MAG: hypothetical protein D6685_19315 [Bacteroidota bacterium]
MATWKKLLAGGGVLLFVSWAYFQLNDTDALPWVALYGATAVASGWLVLRPMPPWIPGLLGLIALVWAGWIAVDIVRTDGFAYVFDHFLEDDGERAREMLGLLITAVWHAWLENTCRHHAGRARA